MNEVIRTIKKRRSIRNYRNEQITSEELETILDLQSNDIIPVAGCLML